MRPFFPGPGKGLHLAAFALAVLSLAGTAAADDSEVVVRGLLSAKQETSFVVDSVAFTVTAQTEFEDDTGNRVSYSAFADGDLVKAKGEFRNGVLAAEALELEDEGDDSQENQVEGLVQEVTGGSLTVQGRVFSVSGATIIVNRDNTPLQLSQITSGDRVEVKFTTQAPGEAIKIELKESDDSSDGSGSTPPDQRRGRDDRLTDAEVLGEITEVTSSALTVAGRVFLLTARTRVEAPSNRPAALAALVPGLLVKVEYVSDGSNLTARKIEIEGNQTEGELEVSGPVSLISDTQITVRGITAALTPQTLFLAPGGESITRDLIHLGTRVRLTAVRAPGSEITAQEVFLKPATVHSTDFDDDGDREKVVYRRSTGTWHIRYDDDSQSQPDAGGPAESQQWGLPEDITVPGDYDGDSRADLCVWRPSEGTWYQRLSSSGFQAQRTIQWGLPGDVPLSADFDQDGEDDPCIWRPSHGIWYVLLSGGGNRERALAGDPEHVLVRQWGLATHIPRLADRDGDGRPDLIVIDQSSGNWFTLFSSGGYNRNAALAANRSAGNVLQFGLPGDKFLLGDFDGDDIDDLSVFRRGLWFVKFSVADSIVTVPFGLPGDVPGVEESGDESPEKRDRLTVYRPREGNHYERTPQGEVSSVQWGLPDSGDVPVGNYAKE